MMVKTRDDELSQAAVRSFEVVVQKSIGFVEREEGAVATAYAAAFALIAEYGDDGTFSFPWFGGAIHVTVTHDNGQEPDCYVK